MFVSQSLCFSPSHTALRIGMSIEIATVPHIRAQWLSPSGLFLTDTVTVDGLVFFKMLKSDTKIHSSLLGEARCKGTTKQLNDGTVFSELLNMRKAKRQELLVQLASDPAAEDIEIDEVNPKHLKSFEHLLPKYFCIKHRGHEMKVLASADSTPLQLELTGENLRHLRKSLQPEDSMEQMKKRKCAMPYFDSKRGAYRVRYTDESGGLHTKDFAPADESQEELEKALEKANEYRGSLGLEE